MSSDAFDINALANLKWDFNARSSMKLWDGAWQELWESVFDTSLATETDLERDVLKRLRDDENFRLVMATVLANEELAVSIKWPKYSENRLLPMPLEFV